MIVIHGEATFGKVDQVPHLFYVGTQFFHVNFVPLVPLKSFLILAGSETDNGFRGVRVPLNWKSVFLAWVRTLLGVLILVGTIWIGVALARLARGPAARVSAERAVVWGVVIAISGFFYGLTYCFRHAGHLRAMRLGALLGVDPVVVAHFVHARRRGEVDSPAPRPVRLAEADEPVAQTSGPEIPEGR